jgi:tRNA pseudouridine38-40 synthase
MRNLKIVVEYDGTDYHGWQRQVGEITIQEVLEEKIAVITCEKITVNGSGRTDAGVHAINQVANFRTSSEIRESNLLRAINGLIPRDIAVQSLVEVDEAFHARYSAKSKSYLYKIYNRPVRSAIYDNYSWHVYRALDIDAMNRAANCLVGTRNYSSFCAANGDSRNTVRTVMEVSFTVSKRGVITFSIKADGFLRYMVRNIVGTLVDVGKGKIDHKVFSDILKAGDRTKAGITAPPQGLFLKDVYY